VRTLTDNEYDSMLDEIQSWKGAHSVAAADRAILKALCARAADALAAYDAVIPQDSFAELIAELRKAAQ